MPDILFVYITCADVDEARRIGRILVQERLAGLRQYPPARSDIYRWEGTIEDRGGGPHAREDDAGRLQRPGSPRTGATQLHAALHAPRGRPNAGWAGISDWMAELGHARRRPPGRCRCSSTPCLHLRCRHASSFARTPQSGEHTLQLATPEAASSRAAARRRGDPDARHGADRLDRFVASAPQRDDGRSESRRISPRTPQSGSSTVATAWAAMPSPRPVKPSRSVVVALTEMRPARPPAARPAARSSPGACGAIFGPLADQRHVGIGQSAAARGDALGGVAQEARAVGILPGRLARAGSAGRYRPRPARRRSRRTARGCRHRRRNGRPAPSRAAPRRRTAPAAARPRAHGRRSPVPTRGTIGLARARSSRGEVLGIGELDVVLRAGDERAPPCPARLQQRGVVGRRAARAPRGAGRAARGNGMPAASAPGTGPRAARCRDRSARRRPLQRVGDGHGRDRARPRRASAASRSGWCRRNERARRVMHQHDVRRVRAPAPPARRARCPAASAPPGNRRQMREARQRRRRAPPRRRPAASRLTCAQPDARPRGGSPVCRRGAETASARSAPNRLPEPAATRMAAMRIGAPMLRRAAWRQRRRRDAGLRRARLRTAGV